MNKAPWSNKELSKELLSLTKKGEGQDLEFIICFPTQVHELAKEIAAFSTSNDGLILIGVSDGGEIIGIEAETAKKRDGFQKRIEGICNGAVKPSVTPTVKFSSLGNKVVLAIEVQKGLEPIYYSNSRPYIRHHSSSRPAEPHEVKQLFENYFKNQEKREKETVKLTYFFIPVGDILLAIKIFNDELEFKKINPWIEDFGFRASYFSKDLFDYSNNQLASKYKIEENLKDLSETLNEICTYTHFSGPENWRGYEALIKKADEQALEIKNKTICKMEINFGSFEDLDDELKKTKSRLDYLSKNAERIINNHKLNDLKDELVTFGEQLFRTSFYLENQIGENLTKEFWEVGKELHLIETMDTYMDGGVSKNLIVKAVGEGCKNFEIVYSKFLKTITIPNPE